MKKITLLLILAFSLAFSGVAFADAVIINQDRGTADLKLEASNGRVFDLEIAGGQKRVLSSNMFRGFTIQVYIVGQSNNKVDIVDGGVYEIRDNDLERVD